MNKVFDNLKVRRCCEVFGGHSWADGTEATKRNDPPVSLPRRLRVEPVDQFFYSGCQLRQLLTLEAASRKRLSLLLSLCSKPLQGKASSRSIYAPDAGSSPRKPGSLPINLLRTLSLCSKPLQGKASSRSIYAPDAGSSPRKSGSLPINLLRTLSLRSKPLHGNASSRSIYSPDAGSSPRKSGSLPLNIKNIVASLQTAPGQRSGRSIYAPDAGSSPRKPGSLPINISLHCYKKLCIDSSLQNHEQINQLLPEGGGLSERTKATNSGFLRRPANSLSCKAPLIG